MQMEQKEVAGILKASRCTIANRERHRSEPSVEFIPKILKFLGYIPKDLFKA